MAKLSSFKASGGSEATEVITGICDGSQVTVSSGTYTLPNVTGTQTLSTSYADATGSPFAYTPPTGTTHVEYSYSFMFAWSNAHCISHWRLYLDSDEVTLARKSLSGYYAEDHITLNWIFKIAGSADSTIGQVTSWTSAKTMKWQAREYGTSNGMDKLHYTVYFDGGSSAQTSRPSIKVTSYNFS